MSPNSASAIEPQPSLCCQYLNESFWIPLYRRKQIVYKFIFFPLQNVKSSILYFSAINFSKQYI